MMRLVFTIPWQTEVSRLSALKGGGSIFPRIYIVLVHSIVSSLRKHNFQN